MCEYLNKWFWIKDRSGILDPVARDQWFIRGWEALQCIEEKEDSVVLCYRNSSRILPTLKSVLEERPAPSFLPNEKVRVIKKDLYAVVKQYLWHYNDQYYYYMLADENGKPLKKRYKADDLEKVESAK